MKEMVVQLLAEAAGLHSRVADELAPAVAAVAEALVDTYRRGGKAILFGNAGNAAIAQQMAAALMGRMKVLRPPLPAVALVGDGVLLTSLAGAFGLPRVFARQVEALADDKDIIIALSSGAHAPNVVEGLKAGRARGARVVALAGTEGVSLKGLADAVVAVPSSDPLQTENVLAGVGMLLCEAVEQELFVKQPA